MAFKFSCLHPKRFSGADNVIKLETLADTYLDVIESRTGVVQELLSFKDTHKEITSCSNLENSSVEEMTFNNVLKFMIAGHVQSSADIGFCRYRYFQYYLGQHAYRQWRSGREIRPCPTPIQFGK